MVFGGGGWGGGGERGGPGESGGSAVRGVYLGLLPHLPLTHPTLSPHTRSLVQNPLRDLATPPIIKLGPEFSDAAAYLERIPYIPDLLYLDYLTVSGNVSFGKDIVLRGTVIVVANEGSRIDLPPGTVLENKVVSGHLRILDH